MTHSERPRRADYSAAEWPAVRDAWAAHLSPRRPVRERVTERVIERMGEIVHPVEMDEATRERIDALEQSLAQSDAALRFLLEPGDAESQEVETLKSLLAASEAENARLQMQADPHNFPANMTEKLSAYDEVGEPDLTLDELTEDVIAGLTKAKRKKFTELLNVELAELQQERGGPREDLKRENEIEALLGLFARVGEM